MGETWDVRTEQGFMACYRATACPTESVRYVAWADWCDYGDHLQMS